MSSSASLTSLYMNVSAVSRFTSNCANFVPIGVKRPPLMRTWDTSVMKPAKDMDARSVRNAIDTGVPSDFHLPSNCTASSGDIIMYWHLSGMLGKKTADAIAQWLRWDLSAYHDL